MKIDAVEGNEVKGNKDKETRRLAKEEMKIIKKIKSTERMNEI